MPPTPTTYTYVLPVKQVADEYAPGDGNAYDALAGAWAVVFYAAYATFVFGWLPWWTFGILGVCAFVRNFNALHEGFHAKRTTRLFGWAKHLFVVASPFMLGYAPLLRNHLLHHTWAQQPERDPDAYLAYGSAPVALFNAITQPEQSFFRYLAREGVSAELIGRFVLHSLVFAGVAAFGGPRGLLAWVIVTRIGNTASWFIFDWILHQDRAWGRYGAPGIPQPIRLVWTALFGVDNLLGVEYHHVHHQYPFVPGPQLPALGAALERSRAD